MIEVFNEQGEPRQLALFPAEAAPPTEDAGPVAHVLTEQVRLERVLDGQRAEVPWSRVLAVLAINRLCAPGSELAIEQRWYPMTALDDLLYLPESAINDTWLYRCLDHGLPHKTTLERHLTNRFEALFAAQFDVLPYDLTSTHVEGAAPHNPLLQRGYSPDHRIVSRSSWP